MLWDWDRGSVPVKALGTEEAQEQLQAEAAEGFLLPPTNAAAIHQLPICSVLFSILLQSK